MEIQNLDIEHPSTALFSQFDADSDMKKNAAEPLHFAYILDWARGLPKSEKGVLDLAAGRGFEVVGLRNEGIKAFGIDQTQRMVQEKVTPFIMHGEATNPPIHDNSISGAILKDAILFFSPEDRKRMLLALQKSLVPGGSLLILSELSDALRIRYLSGKSKWPAHEAFDVSEARHWAKYVKKLQDTGDEVVSVEFPSVPEDIRQLALENGFTFHLLESYKFGSPLAEERRWSKNKPGYICVLEKPQQRA